MLLVTHDLRLAEHIAYNLIYLEQGKIFEEGLGLKCWRDLKLRHSGASWQCPKKERSRQSGEPARCSIDLVQLVYAYGLILLAVALSRIRQIGQEKQMLWASIRMVSQLIAVGYLLHLVFAVRSPILVVMMLLAMTGFSLQVAGSRIKKRMPHFYRVMGSSIFIGCGAVTFYFCLLVVGYSPWYDPRYLIPLAGMIIGNAMNGASLAAERLSSEMHDRSEEIEAALCLGANARQASEPAVRAAYIASLIPTMNTMAATGIVALPE